MFASMKIQILHYVKSKPIIVLKSTYIYSLTDVLYWRKQTKALVEFDDPYGSNCQINGRQNAYLCGMYFYTVVKWETFVSFIAEFAREKIQLDI